MSEKALRDLNMIPGSEKKNESSSKGNITKPLAENTNENLEEWKNKNSMSMVATAVNGGEIQDAGVETGNFEVEYIESQNLDDLEDVDSSLKVLVQDFCTSAFKLISIIGLRLSFHVFLCFYDCYSDM